MTHKRVKQSSNKRKGWWLVVHLFRSKVPKWSHLKRTPLNTYLRRVNIKIMQFYTFFTLHAKQEYWDVKLNAASSHMTTFHTPFGRYNFPENASWFEDGLGHLPEEDWPNMWELQGGCRNSWNCKAFGIEKTHERNLHEAMKCTRKAGIKLNFNKCVIKTKCL